VKPLAALLAGLLFGFGLVLSGMAEPANVLAFLDITGDWNPALAATMAAAIAVLAPASYYARRNPVAGPALAPGRIDPPLVAGAVVFGVGWGLAGICPGPGLLLLTTLAPGAFVFVAAMVAGWLIGGRIRGVSSPR